MNEIWPGWEIVKEIGKGSYGTVYEVVKKDSYMEARSAIKVISVPLNDTPYSTGMPEEYSRTYLEQVVKELVNEIKIMQTFKGIQNVVSIEDCDVVEKKDILKWDIYIRMELLTPFKDYMSDKVLNERDVAKLGVDICNALVQLGSKNIIHRDIKPDNIFVNKFGDFKLGDFGIARSLENMTRELTSRTGTPNYMAPEVYKGESYDTRADIYSLGLVLYRLLNNNCLPFWDCNSQLHTHQESSDAFERRMRGDSLPAPYRASSEMSRIILRACSYDPKKRYSTANEMKEDLESFLNGDKLGRTEPVKPLVHPNGPNDDPELNISILKKIINKIKNINKSTVIGVGTAIAIMILSLIGALSYPHLKELISSHTPVTTEQKLFKLSVKNGTGTGEYYSGSDVQIEAIQIEGFVFSGWKSPDLLIAPEMQQSEQIHFKMPEKDVTIQAVLEKKTCSVIIHGGTGSGIYDYGDKVVITAEKSSDKQFLYWELVSGSVALADERSSETSLVVKDDVEINAVFENKSVENDSDQYATSAMDATSIIGMWIDLDGHRWEFKSDGTMGIGGEYYGASYSLDNGCIIWDGTSIGKESYYYLFDHENNRISIIDRKTETKINTLFKIEEIFEVYSTNNSRDSENPFGSIDELSAGNDFIYIGGWAINPKNPYTPLKIAVYVGGDAATGEFAGEYTGNFDRDDIASNYGVNKEHGISIVVETSFSGLRDIFVYALDEETGNNILLGYGKVRVEGF